MLNPAISKLLLESVTEGVKRTHVNSNQNLVEHTVDVLFEKGDQAIDDFFDPLIKVGGFIDNLFGW